MPFANYTDFSDLKRASEIALAKQDLNQLLQLRLRYTSESKEFAIVSSYIEKAQAQSSG